MFQAFVVCTSGVHYISYVMISYSIFMGISAFFTGWIVHHISGLVIYTSAAGLHITLLITLLLWKNFNYVPIFFIMSSIWGICNGAWIVSINGNQILYKFNKNNNKLALTPLLMKLGGSIPYLQMLSNNPYPKPKKSNSLY